MAHEVRRRWPLLSRPALPPPYRMKEVPGGVLRVGMGVDVQKLSLYYTIRGFGSRGRSWLIDRGQLFGPTDDDEVWNALADLHQISATTALRSWLQATSARHNRTQTNPSTWPLTCNSLSLRLVQNIGQAKGFLDGNEIRRQAEQER